MHGNKQSRNLVLRINSRPAASVLTILIAIATMCSLGRSSQAQSPATGVVRGEKVLHSFDQADGLSPSCSLVLDAAGNLYGTTAGGGDVGLGTAFKLRPAPGGGWTEQVLRNFGHDMDGNSPVSNLIFDAAGNLYGTTAAGGTYGYGTVFEMTPSGDGGWTEQVLYSFGGSPDGAYPYASLIFDAAGNLYGVSAYGGIPGCITYGCGTVFELSPTPGGGWSERVLYSFDPGTDGTNPGGRLIFDAVGNLYGTTGANGTYGNGTVFELTPTADGGRTEQVLHDFDPGTDGAGASALVFDPGGNLYGTTAWGGPYGAGAVFELAPTSGGGWTEQVLYGFDVNNGGGNTPQGGVIVDAARNLYGATQYGGMYGGGTVFELSPATDGSWTETLLHHFGNGTDGHWPLAGLILDTAGNLYGTTQSGGMYGGGTVFEVTSVYPCAKCSHSVLP